MRLRFQLVILMLLRTVLNTAHRMVYPFLPVFARGLGVDISVISNLITVRSLAGAASPLFVPLADRRGRRFGMLAGILLFTAGVTTVALYPSLWTLALALVLAMIGKFIFDPSMQAYLGDRIPYEQRGTALAITEVAWSMAFIAGVPLMARLIDKSGWSAPFPVFGVLGGVMLFTIWRMIPRQDPHHQPPASLRDGYRAVLSSVPALAGISIAMWASAGNELVSVIFGVWLEDSFGLRLAALAGASAVIGLSELSGEGLVAFTTDRLGKPLALTIGLISNALAALLLPFIGRTEAGALIGLFLFYITFEYIMVSHIPLVTELVPSARATVLSLNVTGHSIGRAVGAFLAILIYKNFGFVAVATATVVFNLIAFLALQRMKKG
jgi:predicted MFS family arabinose efflux permease